MTRKCKFCLATAFARKPSWLVLIECDRPSRYKRGKAFLRIPRREHQHHTPQCAWRLRVRHRLAMAFETDERIW